MWTMAWTQSIWIALLYSFLVSGVCADTQTKISAAYAQVEDQIALESHSDQDQIALESHLPVHDQRASEQNPKASYRYGYQVSNSEEGNEYSHDQKTEQGITRGEYRILLPDNRWQIVSYEADHNGYRATVRYESADPAASASAPVEESYWGFSPSQGHRVVSHSTHPQVNPSIQHPITVGSRPQEAYRRPPVSPIVKSKGTPEDAIRHPSIESQTPQPAGSVSEESSIKTSLGSIVTGTSRPEISQGQILQQPPSVLTQPKDQPGFSIHNVYPSAESADRVRSKGASAYSLQYFQSDSAEFPYSSLPVGSFPSYPHNAEHGPAVPYPPQGPVYGQRYPQPKPASNPQGQRVNYQPEPPVSTRPYAPPHTTAHPVISEAHEIKTTPLPINEQKPFESHPVEKIPITPATPITRPSSVPPFYPVEQKPKHQPTEPSQVSPLPKIPTETKSNAPPAGPAINPPYPYPVQTPYPGWLYNSPPAPPYGVNGQVQSHVTHPYPKQPNVAEDAQNVQWVPVIQLVHQGEKGVIDQQPPQTPAEESKLESHQVLVNPQYQTVDKPVEPPAAHPFIPRPPVYVDSAQLLYGLLSKETEDGNSKFLQHEARPVEPKPAHHIHHAPQIVQQQSGYSKINYQPAKPAEGPKFFNPYGSHQVHVVPPTSKPTYSRPFHYENYQPEVVKPPQIFHASAHNPPTGPQYVSFTIEDTKPLPPVNAGFNPAPATPEVSKPFPYSQKFEHDLQHVHQEQYNDFQPIFPNFEPQKYPKKPEPAPGLKPTSTNKRPKSSSRPKYPSKAKDSTPATHKVHDSKPPGPVTSTFKPPADFGPSSRPKPYDSITTYKPHSPVTTYRPKGNFVPINYPTKHADLTTFRPSPELNSQYPSRVIDIVTTYRPPPGVSPSKYKPEPVYYPVSEVPPPQKVDKPEVLTPITVTEAILPPLSPEEIELLEGEAPTEPSIPEETPPPQVKPVIEPPPVPLPPYGGHKKEKKPFDFTPIGPFPSPASRPKNKQNTKGGSGADRPLISPIQHPFKQHAIFGDYGERIQPLKKLNEPASPAAAITFDLEGEAAIEPEPVNAFRPIPSTPSKANDEVDTFIVFRKPEDELEGLPPIEEETQFFDDTAIQFDPAPFIRNRANPIPEMIELAASAEILDKSFVAPQTEASTDPVFFVQTTTSSTLEAEAETEPATRRPEEFLRTSPDRKATLRFTTTKLTESPLESEAETEAPVIVKSPRKVIRKPIGRLRVGVQRRQRNESRTTTTTRPIKRGRFLVVRNESANLSPQFNSSRIRFPPRIRFVQNSERFVRHSPSNVDLSDLVDHSTLRDGVGLDRFTQKETQPSAEERSDVPEHTTKLNDESHTISNLDFDSNLRDLTLDQIERVSERSSILSPVEVRPFEYLFKKGSSREIVE